MCRDCVPLYTPNPDRPMRVAGFMSGSGTNLREVIETGRAREGVGFDVVVIFTDNPSSRACQIAAEYGIPVVSEDILAFYRSRGKLDRKDLSLRPEFDRLVVEALKPYGADLIVLAGYMSIITEALLDAYPARIINVHPADLSITREGRRAFTGAKAVREGILAGLTELRSSTHIVRKEVDGGEILLVSGPVEVTLPPGVTVSDLRQREHRSLLRAVADEHQERLKRHGDWVIMPRTVEWISRGRFGMTGEGVVTFDGKPIPNGQRLDEL